MSSFRTPSRHNSVSSKSKSPRHQIQSQTIDDRPIQEFVDFIENTRAEQWEKRCDKLQQLINTIPERTTTPTSSNNNNTPQWYNSPKTLRHLHPAISSLLKDSRSTVVKRTCQSLSQLFASCRSDARYLFKDLMPTVLAVHAQTVQLMRTHVQTTICEALPLVPCKATMPLWLETLKQDRSKTVREACATYLSASLEAWKDLDREQYLTDEIWSQVGTVLIKSLRDPSPSVRDHVKTGLETIRSSRSDIWDQLVHDPCGPVSRDGKLKRYLLKMNSSSNNNAAAPDDLSVTSRSSHASMPNLSSFSSYHQTHRSTRHIHTAAAPVHDANTTNNNTATTASSSSTSSRQSAARRWPGTAPGSSRFGFSPTKSTEPAVGGGGGDSPATPRSNPITASNSTTQDTPKTPAMPTFNFPNLVAPLNGTKDGEDEQQQEEEVGKMSKKLTYNGGGDATATTTTIAAAEDKSKRRRSRHSLSMRLSRSGSSNLDFSPNPPTTAAPANAPNKQSTRSSGGASGSILVTPPSGAMEAPEHVRISQELFQAHKTSVNRMMEMMKKEMDLLEEFETLLELPPSEEQLLDYFEQIDGCLETRNAIAKELEQAMAHISTGEEG